MQVFRENIFISIIIKVLSPTEVQQLESMVNYHQQAPYSAGIAKSILETFYGYTFDLQNSEERSDRMEKEEAVTTAVVETVKIYPNPNTGSQLALDLSPWQGQVSIQILDVLGRTVYQQTKVHAGAERNLSYSNLPNGFYTVLVLQEGRKLASAPLLIK